MKLTLSWLREHLPMARISLHTNGQLAMRKLATFNMYDRATISFPSFTPQVFARMTGTRHMPDLVAVLRAARIPIKVSCVIKKKYAELAVRTLHEVFELDKAPGARGS